MELRKTTAPLVLCADDFGLAPGVSRGIARLAAAGRLSAVSCMTLCRAFPESVPLLAGLGDQVDIGLHVTFTDRRPLGPMPHFAPTGRMPPVGRVVAASLARRLPYAEIKAELARQLDGFTAALGRPPDFIDGHQHVHVLGAVRRAVLDLYDEGRLDPARTWLRDCREPLRSIRVRGVDVGRATMIALLSTGLRGAAARRGIRTNDSFRGVNPFDPARPFRPMFQRFLEGPGRRPLVMCHPGEPDAELAALDPVVAPRAVELAYLESDAFPDDLAAAGRHLARLSRLP